MKNDRNVFIKVREYTLLNSSGIRKYFKLYIFGILVYKKEIYV